ncbi:MAG TPA: AMP-binding protein [Vicinamibacterales bacterium]|nr:AMP-binding protein [Vicinamibacterales bacterium]
MRPTFMTPVRVLWRRRRLEESCRWTRRQLEDQQQARLQALRRVALERSPFYRRFHRGLEQAPLAALPVLTKSELMAQFDDLVTDRAVRLQDVERYLDRQPGADLFRDRYVVLATSGSTGRRGVFLYDRDEWLTALAMIARPMAWARLSGLRRPPRSALIASATPWHYSSRLSESLSSRLLPALRISAAEPLPSIVRRLNDWQPESLAVYPSVLKQLADEQIAGRLRLRLRSVATSGEVLDAETRRAVRRAWGLPVFDTYGATEYAPIAAECAHGRKHLFEDNAIVEVVDDRGRPVPPGVRGERVLLTVLCRTTQPLIRYEISDAIRLADADTACACGRSFAVIESIEGRTEDTLYFPHRDRGAARVAVHPIVFHDILDTVPTGGWQIRQSGDGLAVSLVGLHDRSTADGLAASLRRALESRGASVGAVTVGAVDALARGATGKAPLIVAVPPASQENFV